MDLCLRDKRALVSGSTAGIGYAAVRALASEGEGCCCREFFRSARAASVLQRFATPDEVASMIVYPCSERASATTGSALRVDGGVVGALA